MISGEWQLGRLHQLKQFGERIAQFCGDELQIVSVDDDFCRMTGCSREKLLTESAGKVSEMIYAADRERVCNEIREKLRQEGQYICQYRMRKNDGLIRVWESGVCERDDEGNERIRSLVVDISTEEQSRRERDTIYENIPGGVMTVLVMDGNFFVTGANHQYFSMLGVAREQYLGSSGIHTFEQDLPGLRQHIVEQAKKNEPIEYDFRSRHWEDGAIRWYRILGSPYQDLENGCEYLCILLDITEQKSNRLQLDREKERHRITSGIRAHIVFEYDIKEMKLQLYENTQNMNFRLCLDRNKKGSLRDIMIQTGFLYEEDIEKFDATWRGGISGSVQIRLLTEDRDTGEKSYQWYEYVATKIMERGKVTRMIGSVKNIEEQKRQEESKEAVHNMFQLKLGKIYEMVLQVWLKTGRVIGSFADGIVFTDVFPSGSYDEFIKVMAMHYVHPDEREQFERIFNLQNMTETLDESSMEEVLFFRIRKPGKKYRYLCFRLSYLGNDSDIMVLSAQDMHEVYKRQLEKEEADRRVMEEALNEAKSMVELRRNFLAFLAREVKEPLQFINTTLRNRKLTGKECGQMQSASGYVLEIIRNLTDYERIERGKIRIENQSFSVKETIQDLLEEWTPKAESVGIRLESHLKIGFDEHFGDVTHLRQIADNMIGNSIMNAETGSTLRLYVEVGEHSRGFSFLSLILEERGIPIEQEYFGREYPIDKINTRVDWKREDGTLCTTFSLMLARRMAELLNGTLLLERREENINVIKLELPFQHGEAAPLESIDLSEEEMRGQAWFGGYQIFVVEREDADCDRMGARLRVNGAVVDVAYRGEEALGRWEKYESAFFDMVLVEGYLPDMEYIEFVRRFRQLERTDTIPVFVIVDDIRQESIRTSMREGVNGFLKKPLNLKRLQQMLDTFYQSGI